MKNPTGSALINYWQAPPDVDDVNPSTAAAVRTACVKVLNTFAGWEERDLRKLNPELAIERFRKRQIDKMAATTIDSYASRFRTGLEAFLAYWHSTAQLKQIGPVRRRNRINPPDGGQSSDADKNFQEDGTMSSKESIAQIVNYAFPLRRGLLVKFELPEDLTTNEVERLCQYIKTLPFEQDY